MKKVNLMTIFLAIFLLVLGFIFGFFIAKDNSLGLVSCKDLAYYYSDIAQGSYELDPVSGYTSDKSELEKETNLRASELGGLILAICDTNPSLQQTPSLEQIRSFKSLF